MFPFESYIYEQVYHYYIFKIIINLAICCLLLSYSINFSLEVSYHGASKGISISIKKSVRCCITSCCYLPKFTLNSIAS